MMISLAPVMLSISGGPREKAGPASHLNSGVKPCRCSITTPLLVSPVNSASIQRNCANDLASRIDDFEAQLLDIALR